MEDLDKWIAKEEVIRLTGLTARTIERKVERKELRRAYRTIPGRTHLAVFHPDDIAALTDKTLTPLPAKKKDLKPASSSAAVVVALLSEKEFLTLKEAAILKGLPETYLRKKVRTGEIPAIKLKGYRIHRDALRQHTVPLSLSVSVASRPLLTMSPSDVSVSQ